MLPRRSSSSAELGLALRKGRGDTLVKVGAVENLLLEHDRHRQRGIDRRVLRRVDKFFRKTIRKRSALRDRGGETMRALQRASILDNHIDESPSQRLFGGDRFAGEEQLLRAGRTDQAREAHRTVAGKAAEP